MLNLKAAPFTAENYRELTDDGHEFLRDANAVLKSDEIEFVKVQITSDCSSEVIENALKDMRAFYRSSFREKFDGKRMQLIISTQQKEGKSLRYSFSISAKGVEIEADTPRGAARALYRLQAVMRLRRAPFLSKGRYDSEKDLAPSLAHLAFRSYSITDMEFPEAYHENYLKRLARTLYTGFHVNLSMSLFCSSGLIPEFDNPAADRNIETLRQIVERAEKYGLQVYISLYLAPLKGDHAAFVRLPEIRGSRFVGTEDLYICCSSNDLVRNFYAEQCAGLFQKVPHLGGLLLISGCEGFLHCHTACEQTEDGRCQCPVCRKIEPEKSVAEMFNVIADGVRKTSLDAEVIIWNYGLYAWSDNNGERFISYLSKNIDVMTNFDTGDDFKLEGAEGTRFDYSFSCVGPSGPFLAQQNAARKKGLKMLAKCESGAALEYCSLQYIPAMTRWERKFANIIKCGCSGAFFNWKFIGFTEGLSQEMAGLMSGGEQKNILKRLAAQHFGVDNVPFLMQAWKKFDRAMDFHPFSIGSAGYFKGPFFIGPAQLLLPTVEAPADIPDDFFWRDRKGPLWMNTLSFVEPFGVKACQKALTKLEKYWEEGVVILEQLDPHIEDAYAAYEIKQHKLLCRLFLCFIRTACNMTEFYRLRDSFQQSSYSPEKAEEILRAMRKTAEDETVNTECAVNILQQNHRIAFSYTYHYGISVEMCQYKLKHTRKVIETELSRRLYGITFNRNRRPQWHF